jgi:hypothetical protein
MSIAPTVLARGDGAPHGGDESLQEVGDGVAMPGGGHRHSPTAHLAPGGRPGLSLRGMSLPGHHRAQRAAPQAKTAIDHPDEARRQGGRLQGEAPTGAGRVQAHNRQADDPIDDGLRTWCRADAKEAHQEGEDA